MWAIKRSGGFTIVQDPEEAEYPDMPKAVLDNMGVDHCVSLNDIGNTINNIILNDEERSTDIPEELVKEAQIAQNTVINLDLVNSLGDRSIFVCPDCGGGLSNVNNEIGYVYRCHVGHAYSEADLLVRQKESFESTLWVALRMMEERRSLIDKISKRDLNKGLNLAGQIQRQKVDELAEHIDRLKEFLFATKKI
jgi:two-component system chemotaxis response regulator CheB